MDMVHVDAMRHKLEAEPTCLLQHMWVTLGEPRGHGNGSFEPACFERAEDARETHAIAVVAQGVIPIVGEWPLGAAGRLYTLGCHVEGEELQRRHDPERDAGIVGPAHGL